MTIIKTLALRGKKDVIAMYFLLAQVSGAQDTSRPALTEDIIKHIARMPLDGTTAETLKKSAKHPIDDSDIPDDAVPSFIKIPIEIEPDTWEKAMDVFKYVFSLKAQPQIPYFLRVAGTAYINDLKEQEEQESADVKNPIGKEAFLSVEEFKTLSPDQKLDEIYRLLLERR